MRQTRGILESFRGLDPAAFEQFVGDLFEEGRGWSTKVLQQSRDRGVDVIAQPPGRRSKVAIQAKRSAQGNNVSEPRIREYAALRQQHPDVEDVIVVTTSSFTSPALEVAGQLDVHCIDGDELVRIVREHDLVEVLEWYDAGKPRNWLR